MKTVRTLVGLGIAVLTDVALGIIVVHAMGKLFNYDIPIYFYLIGMFLSLLPDLDILLQMVPGKKIDEKHRAITHYPIVMIIPICFALSFFSIFWTAVAGLCLLLHYIHDSMGRDVELGIKWLAPFSRKYYTFLPWRVLSEKEANSIPLMGLHEWLDAYMLKPTKESVTGIILFVTAIILAVLW